MAKRKRNVRENPYVIDRTEAALLRKVANKIYQEALNKFDRIDDLAHDANVSRSTMWRLFDTTHPYNIRFATLNRRN